MKARVSRAPGRQLKPDVAILTVAGVLCKKASMSFFANVKLDPKFFMKLSVPVIFFFIGSRLDRTETLRMTMFRDKSALYGRELAEGEKPSWP
ncbi:hypothetical protein Pmani_030488 [Petrolisthes manimaculis]|uniref:NADH dehydrogenase [ubiquinone] 1 beta subcomplex subunit 1 n=1 Tax=Petrolisthes manimaculis TaxID=1843537 RepID=A0AAE1NVW5_9EUCA|nr:hypothetical protein Pmani_030488 [Petrolisthes manimaculis]